MAVRVLVEQSRIRFVPEIAARVRPGSQFPRPLSWWQRTVPIWITASQDEDGRIVLEPNGRVADGRVLELTPARRRRELNAILRYLGDRRWLDFSDAVILHGPTPGPGQRGPTGHSTQ